MVQFDHKDLDISDSIDVIVALIYSNFRKIKNFTTNNMKFLRKHVD